MFTWLQGQWLRLKTLQSIQPASFKLLTVWRPASRTKPCLGLRFHSDILNFKCRKIEKTLLILSLIVVNLLSSSILEVEQQKVTVFFPTFLCYSRNVLFTDYMQLVDSLCSFQDQFWSFVSLLSPLGLEYIVYQQWKSLLVSPTIDMSYYYGSKMVLSFFLAFAESYIKIPLRVLSGSKRHNLSLVWVIFVSFSLPWWLYLYTISFHVDYIISQ